MELMIKEKVKATPPIEIKVKRMIKSVRVACKTLLLTLKKAVGSEPGSLSLMFSSSVAIGMIQYISHFILVLRINLQE